MNRRAFELAISTLIVLIIGVFVLIGIAFALTNGFTSFKQNSQPFYDSSQSSSIKQACSIACQAQDRYTFCCRQNSLDKVKVNCTDTRLEVQCTTISCQGFSCQ